jgi:pyrroline-5-carboxylate reductase
MLSHSRIVPATRCVGRCMPNPAETTSAGMTPSVSTSLSTSK